MPLENWNQRQIPRTMATDDIPNLYTKNIYLTHSEHIKLYPKSIKVLE